MTSSQFGQQLLFESFQPLFSPPRNTTIANSSMLLGQKTMFAPFKFLASPHEYKVIPVRECNTPLNLQLCDTPQQAASYWRLHIPTHPFFNPECECFVVMILNTRRRVKGHYLVSLGTQDSVLVHAREVFRLAVATAANAIVISHNHPSGDPSPSDADIKVTRDLVRAGQLLKIDVLDHVIIGKPGHSSLREMGYLYP